MSIHIMDSRVFGSAWGTDEMREIFDESERIQGWLDVIAALANAQRDLDIIPAEAAANIALQCNVDLLDLHAVGAAFDTSGHSLHGLLGALKDLCDDGAGEWICYGATVHDITDTWMARALLRVWTIALRDLRHIEDTLLRLATTHRDTPMTGRTHGQAALAITFGFKVSVWLRENRRHIERLKATSTSPRHP